MYKKHQLQVIHEDNDTFTIEDLTDKVSMVHGRVLYKNLRQEQAQAIVKELCNEI